MTLFLFLVLVVFFISGYKLREWQLQENIFDLTKKAIEIEETQKKAARCLDKVKEQELIQNELVIALNANEKERLDRYAKISEENRELRVQIFLIKKNCVCGGIKRDEK